VCRHWAAAAIAVVPSDASQRERDPFGLIHR
jgi:hypothetical protein